MFRRSRIGMLWMTFFLIVPTSSAAQTTDLILTKAGNNIVLAWTTGTPNYAVAKSDGDPTYKTPQTLASDLTAGPYTYTNGLTNGVLLQFFTTCGLTDSCQAGNYTGGGIPPVPTTLTSVSPGTTVKVGDIVTINGDGFSLINAEDVVHFPEGIGVKANPSPAATKTQFAITVPRGALSGQMVVQVGHQVSNSLTLVVNTQDGLTNLSGIAYQPNTRDIWLTTRGNTTTVPTKAQYLRFNGTSWPATVVDAGTCCTQKYLGGQGFDSALGWFFGFSNTEIDGKTRKEDTTASPPGAPAVWSSLFLPGGGQNAQVLGVATASTLTDQAFFAYNNTTAVQKHIRVLGGCSPTPCTNLLDADYGNFGATNLNFASLAGLTFDGGGNLYDTETTQVRKIKSDETSSIAVGGFTQATGIAHDQTSIVDPGTLLVADTLGNTLYKVDLSQTTTTKDVVSALNTPRTATFALTPLAATTCPPRLPNVDLSFVLAGEASSLRQVPDPRITIEPSAPTRVWIRKTRIDDTYPTPLQPANRRITITAKVTPPPNPPRTIYFRVVDPPEVSPYADGTVIGAWCDNRDTSATSGIFTSGSNVDSAATDPSTGQASVELQVTDHFAGDNYVCQASFDRWDLSNTTKALAQTGVITAWKRAYIEKDKMFRQGGLLSQDATPGNTSIRVRDWATLPNVPVCLGGGGCPSIPGAAPCYKIAVFDSLFTYEGEHDEPYVGYITCPSAGLLDLHLVKSDMTDYPLSKTYTSSPYPGFGDPLMTTGRSAGFGVIGSTFYEAEMGDQWSTYDDAFIEFWVPPEAGAAVPYLPKTFFDLAHLPPSTALERFSQIWFNNHSAAQPPPDEWKETPKNYFHLVGASDMTGFVGITSYPDADASFVFVAPIENPLVCAGDPQCLVYYRRSTTLHEIVHQFGANLGPACSYSPSHDQNPPTNYWFAWCGESGGPCGNPILSNTARCLMSAATDGLQLLHHIDSVNRLECEDMTTPFPPCAHTDCGKGLRDQDDPQ